MSKFSCPYCYEMHSENDCIYKCFYSILGAQQKCKFGFEKNPDGTVPKKTLPKCLKCDHAALKIYCPHQKDGDVYQKYGFDLEIPKSCTEKVNYSIAMLGAKGVGKTNYIAVLVEEIKQKMSKSFECAFNASNEQTKLTYEEKFYSPIYRKGITPPATDTGIIPPLIYSLDIMDPKSYKIIKSVTITFYDTAGEDLNDLSKMTAEKGYIANADGIIVLLDPLQIPSIRAKLQGKVSLPAVNADTADIIERVIQVFKDVKKVRGNIKVPLALAFSKMDVLAKYDVLPIDSCLRDESEHLEKRAFVKSDFDNTQHEMETLLDNFIVGDMEQKIRMFSQHAYFGVSALGANPEKNVIPEGGVQPHRVLDPLLWLLAQNKTVKTIK